MPITHRHPGWLALTPLSKLPTFQPNIHKMSQLFSSGSEVANFVVSSGLIKLSWAKILDCDGGLNLSDPQTLGLSFSLRWKAYQEANFNIIAFVTSPVSTVSLLLQDADLVSSTALKDNFPFFELLCSSGDSFSIHKAAITLFGAHINPLLQLKNQLSRSSNSLIIAGHSLGGSVASLFTLLLLESLDVLSEKRPLCITFGSPLVGDEGFQRAISQSPAWNSCFLHVTTCKDPIPGLFISPQYHLDAMNLNSQPNSYKPFGTFLFGSEIGCTCTENPEAISELLVAMGLEGPRNEDELNVDYGKIVEQMEYSIIFKGISQLSNFVPDSLRAGIILQLEALGLYKGQQQNKDFDNLIKKLLKLEENCILSKRKVFDRAKKLNDIKLKMAFLEWYKKICKAEEIGYYDSYKNQFHQRDRDMVKHKKFLTNYWKDFVAQTEKTPQKRWLYGSAVYRRMVEPLDIAEYYKSGQKDYVTKGRSNHYIKMEQWLEEAGRQSGSSINPKKQNVDVILTYDSCFWAHVEEARIWCKTLENADASIQDRESLRQKLMKFEMYVIEQMKKFEVSSEIFLKDSSFMHWWREYEKIVGSDHDSPLTDLMKNCKYDQYASGCLILN